MVFNLFKNKKKEVKERPPIKKQKSSSAKSARSMSGTSVSTDSYSVPRTPPPLPSPPSLPVPPSLPSGPVLHETRGIFRTLEATWQYHASLNILSPAEKSNASTEEQADAIEWIPFDEATQKILEAVYRNPGKKSCSTFTSVLGLCTVHFEPQPVIQHPQSKKKPRPQTMEVPKNTKSIRSSRSSKDLKDAKLNHHNRSASSPDLAFADLARQSKTPPPPLPLHNNRRPRAGLALVLNETVRRTLSPKWWYEQDMPDGTKGMCLFDYKNQARLEALAGEKTCFTMTDDAFTHPFTVIINNTKPKNQQEECYGVIHWEIPMIKVQPNPTYQNYNHPSIYVPSTQEMYNFWTHNESKHLVLTPLNSATLGERDLHHYCACGEHHVRKNKSSVREQQALVRRHSK